VGELLARLRGDRSPDRSPRPRPGDVAEPHRRLAAGAPRRAALLLPVRRDVGRGRPHVGPHDPLPGRRPGPRAGLWITSAAAPGPAAAGGDIGRSSNRGRASSPPRRPGLAGRHRHRRPRRHVEGARAAGEEKKRRCRVHFAGIRAALSASEFAMGWGWSGAVDPGARRDEPRSPSDVERHAGARRRPARRAHREPGVVPSQREEPTTGDYAKARRWPATSFSRRLPEPSGAPSSSASRRASPRWVRRPMSAGLS
jgi:hypothetical protein